MKAHRGPGVALGLALTLYASTISTQTAYPARRIKLIAPFPPGGGTDIFARLVATRLTQATGWTIVVENESRDDLIGARQHRLRKCEASAAVSLGNLPRAGAVGAGFVRFRMRDRNDRGRDIRLLPAK